MATSDRANLAPYRRLAWAVVAALGIALLAVALGPHKIGDNFAETDFYGAYAQGARALQHGHVDPSRYGVVGPLYEVALALADLAVPNLLLAAELISLLSLLLGMALWVRLLSVRVDARLGFAAALFMATNATFFRYGYSATNDALAFALQAASLLWLLAESAPRAAAIAGLFGGLAFLTRYNGLVLLPAGIIALLAGGTLQTRRARSTALFVAGFLVPVVPWVIFSLSRGQSFSFQFHHNIAYDVFARARGIPWDDYQKLLQPQFRNLADVIARDPAAVLRREIFNVFDHLRLDAVTLLGLPVALCALAGLALAGFEAPARRLWPVALVSALFFLSLVPVFYSERYGLPLVPFYAALAGLAFTSPRLALAVGRDRGIWLKALVALLPLLLSLQGLVRTTRRALDQLPIEVLDCAETLRELRRPGDRVICRKPHIAFHGGVEPVPFPFTRTLPELASYARERGARWLYFSWPEAEMRPAYWFLLDTTSAVPGLVVRRVGRRPSILYEIVPGFGRPPAWAGSDTLRVWHTMRARLAVNPGDAEALFTLAYIEYGRGEIAAAGARLERALAVAPRMESAWLLLGEIALTQGDGPRARRAYQSVLVMDAGSAQAKVGMGWASLIQRDARGAAEQWRPVITLTRDPATLGRMAEVFAAVGDRAAEAEARAALARLGGGR